jgi:hypothetical protein
VSPDGRPLTEKPTVPLNPPRSVIVIVYCTLPGVRSVWLDGEIESEKSPAWTTSVAVAVWLIEPSVPVKVKVEEPPGVEADVVTVVVHDGLPDESAWQPDTSADAPLGSPLTPLSPTVPE